MIESNRVPYGNRTRVAAVKEKRFTVIQGNLAAWDSTLLQFIRLAGTEIGPLIDSQHFRGGGFSSLLCNSKIIQVSFLIITTKIAANRIGQTRPQIY